MATAGFFQKQPSEKFSIAVDFAEDRLESGESISGTDVSAVRCDDNSDATATIIVSDSESEGVVTIKTQNGGDQNDDGTWDTVRYKIVTVVTTDANNIYEKDVVLEVIDR